MALIPEKAVELGARMLDRAYDRHEMTLQEVARDVLQAAAPIIASKAVEEERERLELDVLCGELQRIAEKGVVPSPSGQGLATDVLTWAEGWLLQLATLGPKALDV